MNLVMDLPLYLVSISVLVLVVVMDLILAGSLPLIRLPLRKAAEQEERGQSAGPSGGNGRFVRDPDGR